MFHTIYIALGTNLGDRLTNLRLAISSLSPEIELVAKSPIYQTSPWGFTEQPDFLNQVVRAKTNLSPYALLVFLKEIEWRLFRKPTFRYGPRSIDLDILFYNDEIIEQDGLIIPHAYLHERAFVLIPLADIAPDLRHPVLNKSITELLVTLDKSGIELIG